MDVARGGPWGGPSLTGPAGGHHRSLAGCLPLQHPGRETATSCLTSAAVCGWRMLRVGSGRLPGRRGEDIRMLPAVVLGQGGAGLAGPAGDGALADLAAGDRKAGDGDGEARGT